MTLTENSSAVTNDTQGPPEISTPLEIAVGIHFHVLVALNLVILVTLNLKMRFYKNVYCLFPSGVKFKTLSLDILNQHQDLSPGNQSIVASVESLMVKLLMAFLLSCRDFSRMYLSTNAMVS